MSGVSPADLSRTKLYVPAPRTEMVERPRLMARLEEGLTRPLTLLCAPAGYGKTTLLSHGLSQQRLLTAWLSLDKQDNDPVRFWSYVIAALQTLRSDLGQTALEGLQSVHPPPLMAVLPGLLDQIARRRAPLVLVLDDYQFITERAVHETLTFFLDNLPQQIHLVIATRADPPLPLARFRVRNQMLELRALDLRFTTEEAAAFLNRMTGLTLSAADVAALEARTEGWIAGLQLAALSMQGRSDVTGFVKAFTGSHVYVAEYLVEEVLQHQPEDVQLFLLHTSILDRLSAGLCEAVTGRPDGQSRLMTLHRANLFVIPLDEEGQWFRYHHLFADLLQARLRQVLSGDAIAALHRRAAAWYEQHGLPVEAVNHVLAAKDFDGAARLVEQNASSMLTRGEMATLLQWFEALPEDATRRRPLLCIGIAWVLTLAGAIGRVEPLLRQAEEQFAGDSDSAVAREVAGNAAAMRAFFAMMAGDDDSALALAQRAEALLPERSVQARSLLPYTLGAAYRSQGQYEKAAEAFARQAQMGEAFGDLLIWATGMCEVVNTRRTQGRLREAGETCHLALRRLAEQGAVQFGSLAKLEVALCEVLREQGGLEEARQRVTDTIARMEAWAMPTDQLFAYLSLMRVQEVQGDFVGAFESLRVAKDLAAHPVLMFLAHSVSMCEIRLLLATRAIAAADRLMDGLQPGTGPTVPIREQELITLARVRLAQGRPDDAAAILHPLAGDAQAAGRLGAWLDILTLQACALDAQGDRQAAVAVLIKSLALAEPEGFVSVFADKGEAMPSLLAAAARQLESASDPASISLKAYVARLLDAFPGSLLPGEALRSPGTAPGLVEPLTAREFEVLQLIAAGDSNRTIADKLVITVSAVKKHAGNIFGKLNVSSRTQAIARARQLGLLPADG